MDVEKIKNIFIEEATEIIESLDIDIIDLENDPSDKELLNNLFRGVHTLKGSANSFGFTRLGAFVHHFEDLLDYYRSIDDHMDTATIDLCLESVDLVKVLFEYEVEEKSGHPDNYDDILNQIQKALHGKVASSDAIVEPVSDISGEFGNDFEAPQGGGKYHIVLKLDDDIFIRGLEPLVILKALQSLGTVENIQITPLENFPELSTIDANRFYMTLEVDLNTDVSEEEIEDTFIYLDEDEFDITLIQANIVTEKEPVVEEAIAVPDVEVPKVVEAVKTEAKEEEDHQEEDVAKKTSHVEKRTFIKLDTKKLDELFDSVGELVIAQNYLAENSIIQNIEDETVEKTLETLNKITRLVQNRVMSLRMVPIRDSFDKMKRVVRDAAKKVGKEVELVVHGEETEIDKTIVEKLADPLIHLIRNAVDHGLETDIQERLDQGKPAEGKISLEAFHKGGNIIIQISDDGRGIDREIVFNKAVEKDVISADTILTDQQVYMLLFNAGFSTAAVISDISGRGVGLDVVRSNIESIRGKIEVESEVGKGSVFRIVLPLTLAIIDGMLVRSVDEVFILPTLSVLESFIAGEDTLNTVKGKGEYVQLRDEMLPLVRLNRKLHLNDKMDDITGKTLICVEYDKGKIAIFVDELIGRQQVVVKSIGAILKRSKEVSGGAVLGNGEIALILNVDELGN